MMEIRFLRKEIYKNYSTIYIIGSGSSLNGIDKSFFLDKLTIGINNIYRHYPCSFVVMHHHNCLKQCIESNDLFLTHPNIPVVSRYECCDFKRKKLQMEGNFYVYDHLDQTYDQNLNFEALKMADQNILITGGTTAINAIGFAHYLGADNIILCGIDGGTFNDRSNVHNYYLSQSKNDIMGQKTHSVLTNRLIVSLRDHLKINYGTNIHSLNPWVNFSFEGNKFDSTL